MRLELEAPAAPVWRMGTSWWALGRRAARERPLWIALLVGLVALAATYQSPRPLLVDIGGPYDAPHVVGFYAPEPGTAANLRWSAAQSALLFRGLGQPGAPLVVRLQLSSGRASGTPPVPVTVAANGHPLPPLALAPASAAYTLTLAPALIGPAGDLRLDFQAPTFQAPGDRRALGFMADFVRVVFPGGPVLPAPAQVAWLLLAGALLYVLLRAVWLPAVGAGVGAGALLLACAGVIAGQRLLLTVFSVRLAVTLAAAIGLALLAEMATRRLARAAGGRDPAALPEWAWTSLRALVAFSVVVKLGGLLYPSAFVIDASFHLKYIQYMTEFFAGGRDWEQYFGKNLAFSVMPKEEWGEARAFIPYSPFFYVVTAPLAWLPLPLSLSVPAASGILEALKVPLVFLVGLGLVQGRGIRAQVSGRRYQESALHLTHPPRPDPDAKLVLCPLVGAALYAGTPATFLLQQWGNWPTMTSLWLVALWVALTTLFWEHLTRPAAWLGSTAALTLTLLSYTVTAAYTGIFGGLAVVGGLLFVRGEWRRWVALGVSLAVAAAVSLAIYYGQYVDDMLGGTLPIFGQAIEAQGKLTTLRPSWGAFLTDHLAVAIQNYHLALIYGLALAGVGLLFAARQAPGVPLAPWQRIWLGAWLLTVPLLTLADFWVDQALKEFWYALPAVALAGGAWLVSLLERGWVARLCVALLGALLLWQSLALWVFRLLFHNR